MPNDKTQPGQTRLYAWLGAWESGLQIVQFQICIIYAYLFGLFFQHIRQTEMVCVLVISANWTVSFVCECWRVFCLAGINFTFSRKRPLFMRICSISINKNLSLIIICIICKFYSWFAAIYLDT